MRKIVFVFVLIFFLQGCATICSLDPVVKRDQKEIYQEGTKTLLSPKKSLVAVRPGATAFNAAYRPSLVVSVANGTERPFNFSTEDISVSVDGIPIKIFTYNELVADIQRQQRLNAFVMALGGFAQTMNAINAGQTYHTGTYDTFSGGNYATGTYSGYSYNQAAVMQQQLAANTQMLANMNAIRAQTNQALNELSHIMLRKSTVFPQKMHGGYIRVEPIEPPRSGNARKVLVVINAGGEIHEFNFQLIKIAQSDEHDYHSKINAAEGNVAETSSIPQTQINQQSTQNTETKTPYIHNSNVIKAHSKEDKERIIETKTIKPQCKFSLQLGIGTPIGFSPNGKYLLSGHENSLKLIDVKTGREIRSFSSLALSAGFSPDGRYIFDSPHPKLYSTTSGRLVRTFNPTSGYVLFYAFSSDSKYLLLAEGKDVSLWDVFTGDKIRLFKGNDALVTRVTFGPNDKYVISWSDDWTLKVWDIISGREINSMQFWNSASFSNSDTPPGGFFDRADIAFSSDGNYMVYTAKSFKERFPHKVELWNVIEGKKVRTFDCPAKDTYDVLFTPDDNFMVARKKDCLILGDISTGKIAKQFKGKFGSIIFNNDGELILTTEGGLGLDNPRITLWNFAKEQKIRTYMSQMPSVKSITFSKDGKFVYSANSDGSVNKWNTHTGKMFSMIDGNRTYKSTVVLDNYGETVLYGGIDNPITLIDTNSGKKIKTIANASNNVSSSVNSAIFSHDGQLLLSEDLDNHLTLWDLNKGKQVRTFGDKNSKISAMAMDPNNRYIIVGGDYNTFKLLDTDTGCLIKSMDGMPSGMPASVGLAAYYLDGNNYITSIAISPDGKYATVASTDSLMLVDIAKVATVKKYPSSEYIECMTFDHNSKFVLFGNREGVIKLWDISSGKITKALKAHDAAIKAVSISPDGTKAVSRSSDSLLCLWDIQNGKLLAQFATYDNREWLFLTPEGYFTASPNADKYLNVRISPTEVTGIARYRSDFNRPDIVIKKLNLGL